MKPLSEFSPRKSSRDGRKSQCRLCARVENKAAWRSNLQANRDRTRQWQHDRYYSDLEASRLVGREKRREEYAANPAKFHERNRDRWLRVHRGETELAKWYRKHILEHDLCCTYCGRLITLTNPRNIDHITPTISGGTGDWDNLTNACQSCNLRKARKELLFFLLDLIATPERMAA